MPEIVGRLRPPRLAVAPASPALGEEYYNTVTNILYWWNGTQWVPGGPGGTVAARAYRNAAFTTGAAGWTKIPLDTTSYDTSGMVQLGNGRLVAPVAGYYQVDGEAEVTIATLNATMLIGIFKNGVEVSRGNRLVTPIATSTPYDLTVSDVIFCNAGDYLELNVYDSVASNSLSVGGSVQNFLAAALVSPAAATAGPTTQARSYRNTALTLTANVWTKLPLDTKSFDPGNNFPTADRYVCPVTGYYQVNGEVCVIASATSQVLMVEVYKNGSSIALGGQAVAPSSSASPSASVSDIVFCNAGDYLELYYNSSAALGLLNTVYTNYLSVSQVGQMSQINPPSGAAGGDLAGSYPNPTIKGIWTDYTLTMTAPAGAVLGNSGVTARYLLMGKLCFVRVGIVAGSTFNGGSGAMSFNLPFASRNDGSEQELTAKLYASVNTTNWIGIGVIAANSSNLAVMFPNSATNAAAGFLSNTAPQVPATGNFPVQSGSNLEIVGFYEIA